MNSKRHGEATQTWADGTKYVGEFKYDKIHGKGIYTWADGREHVGGWKDNKQHGQGKITIPNGTGSPNSFKISFA